MRARTGQPEDDRRLKTRRCIRQLLPVYNAKSMSEVWIAGGGLAGSEAAWQAAERGADVVLFEMRPQKMTPAHHTSGLAELVCSNSFKSDTLSTAHGLLKAELRELGGLLVRLAEEVRVPAGSALAVDREAFSARVEAALAGHPRIRIV